MRAYIKVGLTVVLLVALVLLSGFRAQTIIHDDGSETQDVLKVSDSRGGQKELANDADEFQKRNYTVMDYSNAHGEGFRAMRTITKEGANKSSVDRIVHKTHDGLISSTYYIDYKYTPDSIKSLRLGMPMTEDGVDLEYIISFPSGTRVVSNSNKSDNQGSTYQWDLSNSSPKEIKMQATVWHKLAIYFALFLMVAILVIVLIMEHRRRNVISWKRAAHMRRVEMMLLFIPIFILGYMGYEYFVGTHITSATLDKVSQQQQEELLENREEDKRIHDADARKSGDENLIKLKDKAMEISSALRDVNKGYRSGKYSPSSAKAEANRLANQAKDLLNSSSGLSQADKEVLKELVDRIVNEASEIGSGAEPAQIAPVQQNTTDNQERTVSRGNTGGAASADTGSSQADTASSSSDDSSSTAQSSSKQSAANTKPVVTKKSK